MPVARRPRFSILVATAAQIGIVSALAAGGLLHLTTARADAAAAPPAAAFFASPQTLMAQLSPSGDLVAVISKGDGNRLDLFMARTGDFARVKPIVEASNADVVNVMWVNEHRLIVFAGDVARAHDGSQGNVFAVNRDGGGALSLILDTAGSFAPAAGTAQVLDSSYIVMTTLNDGTDDVIVGKRSYRTDGSLQSIQPFRLNTTTGQSTSVAHGAPAANARSWLFDAGGEPRVFTALEDGRRKVYYRTAGKESWDLIGDFSGTGGGFVPEFFGTDGILYVSMAQANGESALYRYDIARREVNPGVLISLPGFDYNGTPVMDHDTKRLLGVRYETDAGGTVWFDSHMKKVQADIDHVLSATYNQVLCINCLSSRYLIVRSSADRTPPRFYIFDTDDGHLLEIGNAYPDIKREALGARDFVRYSARDGLSIPMYVTTPPGPRTAAWPAVVLVHDGPWKRGGYWEWDREAAFLASRGYLVLEPDFRGSTGFGEKLYRAGFREWGRNMQGDLEDAARWAIEKGPADANRIGLGGEGYGGYATLMGLARDPGLFKAGFEQGGMPSTALVFDPAFADSAADYSRAELIELIGDPDANRADLLALSPMQNAVRVTRPLLMAYGVDDRKVPLARAMELRDAIALNNPHVEWITYPGERHEWRVARDEIDFWTRVGKFLDTYLAHPDTNAKAQ